MPAELPNSSRSAITIPTACCFCSGEYRLLPSTQHSHTGRDSTTRVSTKHGVIQSDNRCTQHFRVRCPRLGRTGTLTECVAFVLSEHYFSVVTIATAQARAWLDDLPGGEFFFASEVPGRSSVVRPLLSRLAADENSPIHREMQGFYSKLWHEDDEPRVPYAERVYGALKLAGPGGGAASAFALNWLGWTLQHPCKYHFATVGRAPTSPWDFARFLRRSNESRLDLSWAEVTLMEAIRSFGILECVRWDEAMDMLRSGVSQQRLGAAALFCPDALLSAGLNENSQPREFHERLDQACDVLARPPLSGLAA